MDKIKIREAIVVEGRYDKKTLSQIIDAPIMETAGFGIFRNKEQMALLRQAAQVRGLIVFTDADGAGFVIRNHIKSAIPNQYLKHAYTPDIFGKERRKAAPGKEGKLGVEGMKRDIIIEALRRAGATFEDGAAESRKMTKADLMELGLYGPGSADRRAALIRHLNFPEKMSTNAFLQAVDLLYSPEELAEILERLS